MIVSGVRCPVHNQLVGVKDGRLIGKCWRCVREAADGKRWLETHRRIAA